MVGFVHSGRSIPVLLEQIKPQPLGNSVMKNKLFFIFLYVFIAVYWIQSCNHSQLISILKLTPGKKSLQFFWMDRLLKVNFKHSILMLKCFLLKWKNYKLWASTRISAIIKVLLMAFSHTALKKRDFRFLKCISKSHAKKNLKMYFCILGEKKSKMLLLLSM